jgi:sterol desaturase/sphingolipid hydroxylase (fatty acid hydroxylase superfamily)
MKCSYDFPFSPMKLIPFYGGAEFHDFHHYAGGQSRSNFSSIFTYCDYIYGTMKVSLLFLMPMMEQYIIR